jgi:hypothetical protein
VPSRRSPTGRGRRVGQKCEQLAVDLGRVGHAHHVGSAVDLDVAGGRQRGVQATPLPVEGQAGLPQLVGT